ncbi:MAG: FKBP-type peptidyl-prolyl cis-trans isomerase [Phycisphaerales bacterium]
MPVLSRAEHTLVIEDLKIGDGPECERTNDVVVHYHGTLPGGKVFDSTRGKEPATFALQRLIPGWQAGIPGMKAGGIRRLVIPPAMAYGSKDRVNQATGEVTIPANSELTFTIQLVEIKVPVKIEDLVVGTGKECPRGATVKVHYRGTLMNGTEFDSSYARNEPIEFSLGGVIRGWQEGVPGMKVGGKRKLTIAPDYAYGAAGAPPTIPPNATLVFEIELLDVK